MASGSVVTTGDDAGMWMRTVSLSEFSFLKLAFAFADQNPPGSGTFDLSAGPF